MALAKLARKRIRSRQREGWPAGNKQVPKPRSIGGSLRKLAERQGQRDGNGSNGLTG
jgi:small conductance mechanosensitive channel